MKRIAAVFLCGAVIAGILSGCVSAVPAEEVGTEETTLAAADPPETTEATEETEAQTLPAETEMPVALTNDFRVALITVDQIDRYWLNLASGAMKAAEELGCEVVNMSPVMEDDAQQAGQIRKAVSDGFDAIVVTADDSDAVAAALQEAIAAGVKVICVDGSATVEAAAVLCTDDRSAGKTAGETMIEGLEAKGIMEGTIGIIDINPVVDFSAQREAGFREAFVGKNYMILETQHSEGDAAKAHAIAEDYIEQGVVGIFCCTDGCTVGAANAVKQTGSQVAVVGFGESMMIVNMVNKGYILAAMARKPATMGYESIHAACAVLHGRNPGDTAVDIGVFVVTK